MKIRHFEINLAKSVAAIALVLVSLTATSKAALFSTEFSLPMVQPQLVTPGDTFSFDIAGFNSTSGSGFLLTPQETATFGTPQTYTAAGPNGQDITITSSEAIGATTTTDTFVVSTPVNFLTTTTFGGITITALQFDLGAANSGSNTISLVLPINTYTSTGSILYGTASTLALTPTVTLGTANLSYSAIEGVNAGTTAISTFAVRQFTFAITYTNAVPEPSTLALGMLGLIGGAVGVARCRARAGM